MCASPTASTYLPSGLSRESTTSVGAPSLLRYVTVDASGWTKSPHSEYARSSLSKCM